MSRLKPGRFILFLIFPCIAAAVLFGLVFTGVSAPAEKAVYQQILRLKSPALLHQKIRFVDIDKEAEAAVNMPYFPRNILAEGITLLRELGAEYAIINLPLGTRSPVRQHDDELGKALRFFGGAVVEIQAVSETGEERGTPLSEETDAWIRQHNITEGLKVESDPFPAVHEIHPPIFQVLGSSGAFGFSSPRDTSCDLFYRYGGQYYPQFATAGLRLWLGNPAITVYKNRIVLYGAELPYGETKDILIPLTESGSMLVSPSDESGKRESVINFSDLMSYNSLFRGIISNLQEMDRHGVFKFYEGEENPLDLLEYSEKLRSGIITSGNQAGIQEYRSARSRLISGIADFVSPDTAGPVISGFDAAAEKRGETAADAGLWIRAIFKDTKDLSDRLSAMRTRLMSDLKDTFCAVGYPGQSDFYIDEINTIVTEQFLDDAPWWYAALIGFAFSVLLVFFISRLRPWAGALTGIIYCAAVAGGGVLIFRYFGLYLNNFSIAGTLLLSYAAALVLRLAQRVKSSAAVKYAFLGRVSPPTLASLLREQQFLFTKGRKKRLTLLSMQIENSSLFYQDSLPEQVIEDVHQFWERIRKPIIDSGGIIHQHTYDTAAVSFGLFQDASSGAGEACAAAAAVKIAENEFRTEKGNRVISRIGIHTGDMVIGSLGTEGAIQFSVLGPEAEFAVSIRNSNKLYGTETIMSGQTFEDLPAGYSFRPLDMVRMKGMRGAVRIFEFLGASGNLTEEKSKQLDLFRGALELFERQRWSEAHGMFIEALKYGPGDGPSELFARRCQKFFTQPPSAGWDGVFELSGK